MSCLYVCNTSSDYISKVNLIQFKEEQKIELSRHEAYKAGPHDICIYKDKLLVANSYSNSLSIVDINMNKEIENFFIGMHCNGVDVFEDNAYIICGELNSIIVFNLSQNKIIEEIPCGNFPHSISINKNKKIIAVSNMNSDSITLIDCSDNFNIKNIKVLSYPVKAIFTPKEDKLLVCESFMGINKNGSLCMIDLKNLETVWRLKVGTYPVDIYCENNICYISNFGDGTISIIDMDNVKEIKRIKIGGMPRGIIKNEENIYVGDNYNNFLIELNLKKETKKIIPIGGEPTGMLII
ncbi:YncE family protein [Clostridium prolinivorans]|uniref:YncE family protein n=1 Tax=Clostridium prolinivorans TaxID=2769420 RepID=UPI000FDAEE05|nr:YncE family protein [Clostridium prolinivorans]